MFGLPSGATAGALAVPGNGDVAGVAVIAVVAQLRGMDSCPIDMDLPNSADTVD
jgi:hypothetical protein